MKKLVVLMIVLASCGSNKKNMDNNSNSSNPVAQPAEMGQITKEGGGTTGRAQLPTIVIYKTDKPYLNNVPVILDSDKKNIVSYPAPADVYFQGELAKPTVLKDGYLLDNRGITANVAFTSYTYEEYSQLKEAPSQSEIMKHIIAPNALVEYYYMKAMREPKKTEIDYYNSIIDNNFRDWNVGLNRSIMFDSIHQK